MTHAFFFGAATLASQSLWYDITEWVLVAVAAIVTGFIALVWEKIIFIIASAVVGGFLIVGSLEYLSGQSPDNGDCYFLVQGLFDPNR